MEFVNLSCSDCGVPLDDSHRRPNEKPCPNCGGTKLNFGMVIEAEGHASATLRADAPEETLFAGHKGPAVSIKNDEN